MVDTTNTDQKKGTSLLVKALLDEGVEVLFGYPGGAVLHIFDEFYRSETNHILVRHEQGAIHAADGYARATGKPGVAIVTSGPGATNAVTGIATAMMDSVPLVVFTGQVTEDGIGKDAFQETDVMGIMTPITKYTYQVRSAGDLQRIVHEAFYIANSGRKGPVVIDIPKNIGVQLATEVAYEDLEMELPGYKLFENPFDNAIEELIAEIKIAKRPLILWGHGVVHADASAELTEFIEKYQIPATSTLLGLGAYTSHGKYNLGMAGMHGTYAANMALMECDLLINIGSRFDDRVASDPKNFAPHAKICHIDIDHSEINKIIETDFPIVGDAKQALQEMLAVPMTDYKPAEDWIAYCLENKRRHPLHYDESDTEIKPQRVIEYLGEVTKGNAFVITDVGQHQMWAAQFYPFTFAKQMITSGGLGTMGFGVPAAIGVAVAQKERPVINIVGDGGFQMTNQELNIMSRNKANVKTIILNNEVLGMVHQWQLNFYEGRYSHSEANELPDFVKLSEALGVKASRVSDPNELEQAIDEALAYDGPYVLEVKINPNEIVTPMVASGLSNDQMEGVYTCTD